MSYFFKLQEAAAFKFPQIPIEFLRNPLLTKASHWGQSEMKKITSTPVPDSLYKLLESKSKKDQEKLLKGLSLTSSELISFVCNAWIKHKFSFSQYSGHHNPKDFENKKLPRLAHKDEN